MSTRLDLGPRVVSDRPTILVVEDEPHIREVLSGLLGALGYRLLMAPQGVTRNLFVGDDGVVCN